MRATDRGTAIPLRIQAFAAVIATGSRISSVTTVDSQKDITNTRAAAPAAACNFAFIRLLHFNSMLYIIA